MNDFEVFSGEALFFLATELNGEWVILDAERDVEDLQALAEGCFVGSGQACDGAF